MYARWSPAGVQQLADDMMHKLRVAIKAHRNTDLRCDTFGR